MSGFEWPQQQKVYLRGFPEGTTILAQLLTWKKRRDLSSPAVKSNSPVGWNSTDLTVALLGSWTLASFKRVVSSKPAGIMACPFRRFEAPCWTASKALSLHLRSCSDWSHSIMVVALTTLLKLKSSKHDVMMAIKTQFKISSAARKILHLAKALQDNELCPCRGTKSSPQPVYLAVLSHEAKRERPHSKMHLSIVTASQEPLTVSIGASSLRI